MSDIRYRVALACGIACLLLAALLLGLSSSVHGKTEPAGEFNENVPPQERSLPRVSLQSTDALTAYLPLVLRDYPPPPPVFGVQMHAITNSHGLTQALAGGAHWVRYSAFHWDIIEPNRTDPPTYDWGQVDEASLRNAHENGLETIAIVQFTPLWAQKYAGSYCGPIRQDRFDEFAQFLAALVSRYRSSPYAVKYWELGNEPDHGLVYGRQGYGCWGEIGDPYYGGRYYGEMLKVAYPAIKAADPDAQVLIGGLLLDCDPNNPPPGKDCKMSRFLEGILRAGGGPYFDIVSFHAYAGYGGTLGQMGNEGWPGSTTAVPEKTAFLRGVLNRFGYGDKELMNTESALLCGDTSAHCLNTQGMYIPRAYAEALALGLAGQVHFDMNGTWYYTGLLHPDLTPKPVYYAYQVAAGFLADVDYVGPVTGYPSGVVGYAFEKGDGSGYIDVVWSADGSTKNVFLDPGESAYDRYGSAVAEAFVEVSYEPFYIERP
jgi:hypothetical protein